MKRFLAALLLSIALVTGSGVHASHAAQSDAASSVYKGHKASLSDMTGLEPSTYTGSFFTKDGDRFRLCVIQRESHANYHATGQQLGEHPVVGKSMRFDGLSFRSPYSWRTTTDVTSIETVEAGDTSGYD